MPQLTFGVYRVLELQEQQYRLVEEAQCVADIMTAMLQSEFQRVEVSLPMVGRRVIDAMDIFVQKEPTDLNTVAASL